MEVTEEMVKQVLVDKIEANGHQPESVRVVQKGLHAYIGYVTFPGSDEERQAVITRQEVLGEQG